MGGDYSLFQNAAKRAAQIPRAASPIVICGSAGISAVNDQLSAVSIEPAAIIVEPEGRNTAPAIAAAARLALDRAAEGETPILAVLAADHMFRDTPAFLRSVEVAYEAAISGSLVVFGVSPDRPETGYGYIRKGEEYERWARVSEFVEKPGFATAQGYLNSGEYAWNSGMFLFDADKFLDELSRFEPDILDLAVRSIQLTKSDERTVYLDQCFADAPSVSIDYAVMERTRDAVVVPLDAGWSDVGSWDAVYDLLPKDEDGNSFSGSVVSEVSRNCLVKATHRKVGIVGLEDVIVVETDDAVLVMPKSESQRLKDLVAKVRDSEQ